MQKRGGGSELGLLKEQRKKTRVAGREKAQREAGARPVRPPSPRKECGFYSRCKGKPLGGVH